MARKALRTDDLTYFRWVVLKDGYRWVRTRPHEWLGQPGSEDLFLVSQAPSGKTSGFRYAPLQMYSGLFRIFSAVEISESGILKFANTYGTLGGNCTEQVRVVSADAVGKNHLEEGRTFEIEGGERFGIWEREVQEMRHFVELWEAAKRADLATLSNFIQWQGRKGVIYQGSPIPGSRRSELIASSTDDPETLSQFAVGDLVAPATLLIQRTVNRKMEEHSVRARLLQNPQRTVSTLYIAPDSLVACLWLQFAKAIEGNKEYHQCENCRRWFEVGGSRTARSDKRFCSPTCRAGAHRKKRTQARELHSGGMSLREVARKLETDVQTLKGWVSG